MNKALVSSVVLGVLSANPALAQRGAPANSLPRALATFAAADTSKDGKLSLEEATAASIQAREFAAQDLDKDGSWSKDEFLLFYRQRLVLAGQQVGADLDAETTRIQALRKAKETEEAKKRAGAVQTDKPLSTEEQLRRARAQASGSADANRVADVRRQTPTPIASSPESAEATQAYELRLQRALEDLEQRAAARQVSHDDFQRIRDLFIAHARAGAKASGSGDTTGDDITKSETYLKLHQALERLEKRATEGVYSPEEYAQLRGMMIHRARSIESGGKSDASSTTDGQVQEPQMYEVRLQHALDDLERRAAARQATREDFQRIRDLFIARARAGAKQAGAGDTGGQEVTQSEAYIAMNRALERLEKRAAEGAYTPEEYQDLRGMMIHRARAIENGSNAGSQDPSSQLPQAGNYEVRLQHALDDLEQRAAARKATPEDFQRIRELFIARARAGVKASTGTEPSARDVVQSEPYIKLHQALERLAKRAAESAYTPEEYQDLRLMMIHRGRAIENGRASTGSSAPAVDPGPGEARRRAAEAAPKSETGEPRRSGSATPSGSPPPAPEPAPQSRPQGGADKEKPKDEPKPQRPAPPPSSEGRPGG